MKRILLFIICVISFLKACDLKTVIPALKDGELLQIKFTQTKKITGIPKDLISSGTVFLTKSKGLRWETYTPFQQSMLIDKTGIYNIVNGKKVLITENKNQQANQINGMLSKILIGDFDALDMFDIHHEIQHSKAWKKILTPKSNNFKVLKTLTIEGNTRINKVIIKRANGDVETIKFYDSKQYSPAVKYLGKFE